MAGTTSLAYETVQLPDGFLLLLAPMSEVAGRMATQVGAHYLERNNGGRGVLLGGAPGVRPGPGGGPRGGQRRAGMPPGSPRAWRPRCSFSTRTSTGCGGRSDPQGEDHDPGLQLGRHQRAVALADLVIGAVLVAGGRARWSSPTRWSRRIIFWGRQIMNGARDQMVAFLRICGSRLLFFTRCLYALAGRCCRLYRILLSIFVRELQIEEALQLGSALSKCF